MAETVRHCRSCDARLAGAFCSECGAPANPARPSDKRVPVAYVIGGAAIVVLGTLLVVRFGSGGSQPATSATPPAVTGPAPQVLAPADSALAPAGRAPDLAAMTPIEQFDRLFDRVMRASEGGDTATVVAFGPMALAAYEALASPDADARFHAGLIRMATGDLTGAARLADSIAAERSTHLFGILLKGRIAKQSQDTVSLKVAYRDFLAAYPAEMAAQRPEYPGHQNILDRFLQDAKDATS